MKYFIVGLHASGKQQIARQLTEYGLRVGKVFRSIDEVKDSVYTLSSIVYDKEDINKLADNQAYIFFSQNTLNTESFFEGLSFYEYDNNDIFVISPQQFSLIPHFDKDTIFIWLDNTTQQRRSRYLMERRKYNFKEQENLERENINDFIERVCNRDHLYFINEEPSRVGAIIYSLIQHPDLIDLYKKNFNQ